MTIAVDLGRKATKQTNKTALHVKRAFLDMWESPYCYLEAPTKPGKQKRRFTDASPTIYFKIIKELPSIHEYRCTVNLSKMCDQKLTPIRKMFSSSKFLQ